MKGARYRKAVEIIALNDEPLERDVNVIEEQISVALIADIFDVPPSELAKDIVRFRQQEK
jgi:hypothetical protein